jgi:hypothetical protein
VSADAEQIEERYRELRTREFVFFLQGGGTITLRDWSKLEGPDRECLVAASRILEEERLARILEYLTQEPEAHAEPRVILRDLVKGVSRGL